MLVYEATKGEFIQDVFNDSIANKILKHYNNKIGGVNPSEIRAWKNSMEYMYKVINTENIPNDSGIAIEFRIPLTNNRIDFIISGYDETNKGSVIIVELKQWEEAKKTEKDGVVETILNKGWRETTHPCYQIWSYYNLINDFNESVQLGEVILHPCAYLHNYKKEYESEISNQFYSNYTTHAPMYLSGDASKLREFIQKHIKKGDQKKNLYEINSGKLRPAKALQDVLLSMLKGKEEFFMIDSQKVIYENSLLTGFKSDEDCKKRVIIIEGGPGTGKSVLAINLLVKFIEKGLVSQYVSKNSAPRNVYSHKLKAGFKGREIFHLFRGSGSYVESKSNEFSVLLVDEAHRLNEKSGMFKNLGENQIKEIINASKCSIFFIDENQKVDLYDIGSKEEIIKFAKQAKAEIFTYELESQFRCAGSDGYLSWLDDILEIRKTANSDGFEGHYDFKIIDSPNKLKELIFEKNKLKNKARLVAGYCWNWISEGKNNSNMFDINIDDFHMSWNLGNTGTWAIDENSVNEIGCIHTSQGLEFDYVGVIIGKDLRFENGKIISDFNERAKTDNSLKGIKTIFKQNPQKANKLADEIIKNTYRTLMTRGQKGCYIYCCDKELQNYFKERLEQWHNKEEKLYSTETKDNFAVAEKENKYNYK
ncbi:MAG: DNA/RNA helicase domain-containing protein [Candidatus Woesearchaeota archaeon]